MADLEKCFQELISFLKIMILLGDRSCLQVNTVSSDFQALLLLQDKICGMGLKTFNSSKTVIKKSGPALARINNFSADSTCGACIRTCAKNLFEKPFSVY